MEEKNKKDINRRDFIKIVGISAATSTGCYTDALQRGLLLQVAQQEKERCPPIK